MKVVKTPPNPFHRYSVDWLDVPPATSLQVYEEEAKSVITENKSPDVGFRYSINPYRGCFHACAYCYARPSHQYLDFGAGSDFERKIVVKRNAPEVLRKSFERASWRGEQIVFSGNTDCYQPLEASYELTKRCLEVCLAFRNPVAIITKGALIERDSDLIACLSSEARASVVVSCAFSDDGESKLLEPGAPRPSRRFQTMARLAAAGIRVGVGVAPIIPGLTDHQMPEILARAREAGASFAFMTLLRLPREVEPVFLERLHEYFPSRAKRVIHAIEEMRAGRRNSPAFHERMRGSGERWEMIEWLFKQQCEKLGLNSDEDEISRETTFIRPERQLTLPI